MMEGLSALEFQDRFRTESDCLSYIAQLRWPKGFRCPNCDHDVGYQLKTRPLIQCAVCRHQTSITSGTIFHKTRTPLREWFWMIYQMCQDKGGSSSSKLARQLDGFQSTIWNQLQKLRHAMERRDEGISLAGYIELDEAVIGPHARKTGRQKTGGKNEPRKKCLVGGRSSEPRGRLKPKLSSWSSEKRLKRAT